VLPNPDTIVALSTPPGRGALGLIRLSGPQSLQIARVLVSNNSFAPEPNHVSLRDVHDPTTGEVIDRALLTFFRGPRSFTGEDVIELSCHGSPLLLHNLLEIILRLDARIADPGEFTLRALGNGRMSLPEAEAVRDLIDAQTNAALKQANRQLRGELSHTLQPLKEKLLDVIVRLESSIEFVEDDLPAIEHDNLVATLDDLSLRLDALARSFTASRLMREGIRVTLLGRPNVGKSSLFNRLLATERAIVTAIPGTTRDTLTESFDIDGIPVTLTDTAGLRTADDQVESMGMARARRAAADSDLSVVVIDGAHDLTSDDLELLTENHGGPRVLAMNKSDLSEFRAVRLPGDPEALAQVAVSARTGAGIEELRAAILAPFKNGSSTSEGLLITNARHHDLLRRAADEIASARTLLGQRTSEDIVLVGLHNSLRYLGDILGETTTDDILGQIFATFCIGK